MATKYEPHRHELHSPGGKLLAYERMETTFPPDGYHWYIIVLDYDGEPMEELDIVATDKATARKLARQIMAADYEPGGKVGQTILA